jgi:thiamine-phosphate pyrophosphorylase
MLLPSGLLPILDPSFFPKDKSLPEVIEELLETDVNHFIYRDKNISEEDYLKNVDDILDLQTQFEFEFITHSFSKSITDDSLGIHLGADQNPKEFRKLLNDFQMIGQSVHSFDEARRAEDNDVDYVILGAIFETPKPHDDHPIIGINELYQTCEELMIPVFAVGGIEAGNLGQIHETGAFGFSALRELFKDGELTHNTTKLQMLWESF